VVSVFFPTVSDKEGEVLEVKQKWLHGLVAAAAVCQKYILSLKLQLGKLIYLFYQSLTGVTHM
jgi:hypothetical protein